MATVLVVEDRAETRRPLAKLLRSEGYNVLTAVDAYSAGATIRNERPDLILLDVGIPPMDGLTMLSLLQDDPQVRQIPVVIITGHENENTVARAQQLGVKDYLLKSQFTPEKLLETVKNNIRHQPPQ